MPKIPSLIKNVITQAAAGEGADLGSQRLSLPVLVLKDKERETKADSSCLRF